MQMSGFRSQISSKGAGMVTALVAGPGRVAASSALSGQN